MNIEFKDLQEQLAIIRRELPEKIAQDLLSVQPLHNDPNILGFMEAALKSKETIKEAVERLRAAGYEPVDPNPIGGIGLMWVKKGTIRRRNSDEECS